MAQQLLLTFLSGQKEKEVFSPTPPLQNLKSLRGGNPCCFSSFSISSSVSKEAAASNLCHKQKGFNRILNASGMGTDIVSSFFVFLCALISLEFQERGNTTLSAALAAKPTLDSTPQKGEPRHSPIHVLRERERERESKMQSVTELQI